MLDLLFVKLVHQSGFMAAVAIFSELSSCLSDFLWNFTFSVLHSWEVSPKCTYCQKTMIQVRFIKIWWRDMITFLTASLHIPFENLQVMYICVYIHYICYIIYAYIHYLQIYIYYIYICIQCWLKTELQINRKTDYFFLQSWNLFSKSFTKMESTSAYFFTTQKTVFSQCINICHINIFATTWASTALYPVPFFQPR